MVESEIEHIPKRRCSSDFMHIVHLLVNMDGHIFACARAHTHTHTHTRCIFDLAVAATSYANLA